MQLNNLILIVEMLRVEKTKGIPQSARHLRDLNEDSDITDLQSQITDLSETVDDIQTDIADIQQSSEVTNTNTWIRNLEVIPVIETILYESSPGAADNDRFGQSVSLSRDGSRALIGAPLSEPTSGLAGQGQAFIYTRSGTTWSLETILHESSTSSSVNDFFGIAVSLSADGTRALIGAHFSTPTGGSTAQGQAFIYSRSGTTWSLETILYETGDGTEISDNFAQSVSLSADGSRALIGAFQSEPTGGTTDQGQAFIYSRSGTTWSLETILYESATSASYSDNFGTSVSLSADGSRALIGALYSEPTGGSSEQGQAFIYSRSGTAWSLETILYESTVVAATTDLFGISVSLSADGSRALISAPYSEPTGGSSEQGQAFIYSRSGTTWTLETILYESGAGVQGNDFFGYSVSLSADGKRALIGAYGSEPTGGTGAQGQAFIYSRSGTTWSLETILYETGDGTAADDQFGFSVSLSADGSRALIGVNASEPTSGSANQGQVFVYNFDSYWTELYGI